MTNLEPARRFLLGAWRVERFATIDSTSEEAKRRWLARDPGHLWIMADQQTAGRGRQGRDWRSPFGNFFGSALIRDPCEVATAPQLGFVAGVALRAAALDLGAKTVRLKWPNDLVAEGAKLAGMLLEGWSGGENGFGVSIGIGVNLSSHPDDLPYRAAHLDHLAGRPIRPREFIERLAPRLDEALATFDRGRGFAEIRSRWLEGAAGLGEPLRVTSATGVRDGLFEGIDARGRLLLGAGGATEAVESADITLLGATAETPSSSKA